MQLYGISRLKVDKANLECATGDLGRVVTLYDASNLGNSYTGWPRARDKHMKASHIF